MNTLINHDNLEQIRNRVNNLTPETQALWGNMTVGEMVCHVSDPIRDILGIRITEPVVPEAMRPALVQMVLTADNYGQGAPTSQPYLQADSGGGTKPTDFESDRNSLLELMNKFYATDDNYKLSSHAALGILTREQFGIYLWKHLNHHLSQFGV